MKNNNIICVSIDGIDTSGKSTAIIKIKKQLEIEGYDVVIFKDFTDNQLDNEQYNYPNQESFITEIRNYILNSEHKYKKLPNIVNPLLFTVARLKMIEDINTFIELRLKSKPLIIILDRYIYSTLAYQISLGCDVTLTEYLCSYSCKLLKPHLSVLLDINHNTYITRLYSRREKSKDDIELNLLKESIFNNIRNNFLLNFKNSYTKYADQHLIIDNNIFNDNNIDLIINEIKSIF